MHAQWDEDYFWFNRQLTNNVHINAAKHHCSKMNDYMQHTHLHTHTHTHTRAANPSLDYRVAKSDFKCNNLILSVVHIVLLCNLIFWKHAPEQLSSMISCREGDVYYKEICEKRLCSNYVQMLWRWRLTTHKVANLQCTSYCFSFVYVPLPADVSFDSYI